MKKIKFLSCAAMVAFMALGFTSCEKENFKTEIVTPEINVPTISLPGFPKDGDAVIDIKPTVIGYINNKVQDITAKCDITYNGDGEYSYKDKVKSDGSIEGEEVNIVATYTLEINEFSKTYTVEKTIKTPSLSAGMACILSPTLIINASGSSTGILLDNSADVVYDESTHVITITNTTPYYYTNYSFSYEVPVGTKVEDVTYGEGYENDEEAKEIIDSFNEYYAEQTNSWSEFFYNPVNIQVPVIYAEAGVEFTYTQLLDIHPMELYKEVTWSRSEDTKRVTVAKFNFVDYYWITLPDEGSFKLLPNINGHGSHYHGHGHGDANNAGGGISWAE